MLDEKDFSQIRDYIIRILPELIRREPEIATTIEGMLAELFPRRDEFARLLDEVREHRVETRQRSEQVDQRFDRMDKELGEVKQGQLEVRRGVAQVQHGQEMLLKRMDGQEAWLRFVIGDLHTEKGQMYEDLVAVALRYGLKNPDISPDKIRLRQKLVDAEGRVFRKRGQTTEIDLIAEDGKLTVFEVKATAEIDDVEIFAQKVELVAAQNPDKAVRGVFITLAASHEVRQRCAEYGLDLVD